MQMKPLPHPTGPLTQPIGPFQPGPPQLSPPPQSPRFPQFPPQHPLSPQSPCPWPWPSSCAHGVPDATGDGGLAFATPAPSPKAVKPSAPAIIASAKIFTSFIVQPLYDSAYCNPASLDFRPLRGPPQRAALVLVAGSKGLACPNAAPRHPITRGGGPTLPSTQGSRLGTKQRLDHFTEIFGRVRFCRLAWLVWLLVLARWCAPLPARGSSWHPSTAQTAIGLVPARRS